MMTHRSEGRCHCLEEDWCSRHRVSMSHENMESKVKKVNLEYCALQAKAGYTGIDANNHPKRRTLSNAIR